jgi:hypothetical protein
VVRQREHQKLIMDYDRLIPKIKFNKNDKELDEFGT